MVLSTITPMLEELQASIAILPENYKIISTFAIYFILIAIYVIFVWKFYRFLAKRDITNLNLYQYNRENYTSLKKFFAVILYILQYIIMMPILVIFWFSVLALFVLVLSEGQTVAQVVVVSAAVIGVVRFTSYISEDLSRDIAKLLPFTILGVFLISGNFFSIQNLITRISEIPSLFNHIAIYIIIIAALEIVMRIIQLIGHQFADVRNVPEPSE